MKKCCVECQADVTKEAFVGFLFWKNYICPNCQCELSTGVERKLGWLFYWLLFIMGGISTYSFKRELYFWSISALIFVSLLTYSFFYISYVRQGSIETRLLFRLKPKMPSFTEWLLLVSVILMLIVKVTAIPKKVKMVDDYWRAPAMIYDYVEPAMTKDDLRY